MSVINKLSTRYPKAHELMSKISFCVFDLETTGGHHDYDKIIEIGMVKIKNLEIVEQADYLLNPEIEIPPFIQKLTAITSLDVEGCPIIEEVIDDIIEFMDDSILVAHNTSFDVPFLNSVLTRLGKKPLENKTICTNLMTRHLMPNLLNSNLHYMSNIFNIKHTKAHRALDDAMASAKLLLKYLEIFISKDIGRINHLHYPQNRYQLDCRHYVEKNDNEINAILKKIRSLKSLALIVLKGKQGKILFAFPCLHGRAGEKIIEAKLRECDWMRATLKLHGSFLEILVHLGEMFNKIKGHIDIRREIVSHLEEVCLPKGGKGKKAELQDDFVIAHDLVPEQMVILPVHNVNHRTQLIFRYPGHEKKLLQYIKKHREGKNHFKSCDPILKDFIVKYLPKLKSADNGEKVFSFKRKTALGDYKRFLRSLNNFVKKNPNPHNYPHYYI